MGLKGKRSQTNVRIIQRENKKLRGGGSTCDWTGKECICQDGTAENAGERKKIDNNLICNSIDHHWTGEKCLDKEDGSDVKMAPLCKVNGPLLMDAIIGKSKGSKRKSKTKKRKIGEKSKTKRTKKTRTKKTRRSKRNK